MGRRIDRITLKGFKSIKSLEGFELTPINILIGANGCGKSNFVSFFALIRELVEGRLEKAVNIAGRADALLFLGPKVTEKIECKLDFGDNGYRFTLLRTNDNRLIFDDERILWFGTAGPGFPVNRSIGSGHSESKLKEQIVQGNDNRRISQYIHREMSRWVVYHFHDTSETAALRSESSIRDSERLRHNGGNLASFLHWLRENDQESYVLIRNTIRLAAPFFDDFLLRPKNRGGDEFVDLEWSQKGSDFPFHPNQLSDGTLRFIALATALLQPNPPATILIDEPELGLHPYAIELLANLIRQAEERTQLIVSTQSAALLNAFDPEQIVVIDREDGESKLKRLTAAELESWSRDYTLGELWQKNVYGGGPRHE